MMKKDEILIHHKKEWWNFMPPFSRFSLGFHQVLGFSFFCYVIEKYLVKKKKQKRMKS